MFRLNRVVSKAAPYFIAMLAVTNGSRAFGDDPAPKANPAQAAEKRPESSKTREESVSKALDESWPERPEWVDMLTDIMEGSQLGPTDGWFRRAVAQKRYTWEAFSSRFDKDGNGKVVRKEFPGSDADFARLDRDRDNAATARDFDFSAHALSPSPGAMLFYRADRDGNGKLTREEMDAFFKANDSGQLGYLSLGDLQAALPMPSTSPPPVNADKTKDPTENDGPSKATLIRGLFRQEIGSLQPGPNVGEKFKDFSLKTTSGDKEVTLSRVVGPKPVVLVFGNITCGPFRSQAGNVEKLYQMYKDRAEFVMVYVREAHPTDGWSMDSNARVGVSIPQPTSYGERVQAAQACTTRLGLGFPVLVDTMEDSVGAFYSGMPSRLYVIDQGGAIAYKSGRGPFGFKPAELEQSLILLLNDVEGSTTAKAQVKKPGEDTRSGRAN